MADHSQTSQSWPYTYDKSQNQNQSQYVAPPGTQPDYPQSYYASASQSYAQYPNYYAYPPTQASTSYTVPNTTYPPGIQPLSQQATIPQPDPPGVTSSSSWYSAASTQASNQTYYPPTYSSAYDPNYFSSQPYSYVQSTAGYQTYPPQPAPPGTTQSTTLQTSVTNFTNTSSLSMSTIEAMPQIVSPPANSEKTLSSPTPKAPSSDNVSQTTSGFANLNVGKSSKSENINKPAYNPISFPKNIKKIPAKNPLDDTKLSSASESPNKKAEQWPDSLKLYVKRSFDAAGSNLDGVEEELKKLISLKLDQKSLWTTDWVNMPLPMACTDSKIRTDAKSSPDRHPHLMVTEDDGEESKREMRLKRFGGDSNNTSTDRQEAAVLLDETDVDYIVVGTSQKLEKKYLRLTSAPDPSTIRPLEVLQKTLELLKDKWIQEQNYSYICDQFKSMRQDLTVQHIQNEFTVKVYETHARIALEKGDLGEYNQCQTQLRELYKLQIPGNKEEFTAYRLLYFLHTKNRTDIMKLIAELSPEMKNHSTIKHALEVRRSLATSNYHRFFKLYLEAPYMGGYLMDHFVERERVEALLLLCKAFRPNLDMTFIREELGFTNMTECIRFMHKHGVASFVDTRNMLDTKAALEPIRISAQKNTKIDIKGQI